MAATKDIREAVEGELTFDPLVDATDITVRNMNGDVALNGTVPSYPQYLEAAAAAQRVSGVKNVHNHLAVVLPDADYRDDAMLTTAANNALMLNVTVPDGVEATARNGNLTLTGMVKYGGQRDAAELAVAGLAGVRHIKDDIDIIYDADPVDVTWLVQDALDRLALIADDSDVSVNTSGSIVTLRGHVRTWVALADAGSFTQAAERMFVAQPTLSQQIRRLEEIVGTQLLQRRREGLRLTTAGTVLLDASRTVLSLVDHEVSRTRQAAGLGRQRLRVVLPPRLPDALAVQAASALRSAAAAADVEVVWMETPLDSDFSLIRQRRADAGLGWLTASPETLPAPLDVMSLGDFEPDVWIPSRHIASHRGTISPDEMVRMDVVHGPRRVEPGTYDAWTRVLRTVDPGFEFTDPPFRHSLPMALAFAATADRPTAVLTGPSVIAGSRPGLIRLPRPTVIHDMVRVGVEHHSLTATAALVWSGDLPRPLQQILFDTADGITEPAPARCG
jgi:DNA-binding transcriptional LysR family regulator/osmotically-inducible protein OsmY